MKLRQRILTFPIVLAFLIGQWGCVTAPIPHSLEETYRQQLGRIGVVTAQFVPNAELTMPHPSFLKKIGQEAAEGAKSGASRALERGGGGGHPAFIVFWVLAGPIVGAVLGGLGGAVYGAFTTPDIPQSIQDTENLLKQKLAKLRMQETLQDYFVKIARTSTPHNFVLVENQGPRTPEEHPTYAELVAEGLDTILELRVQSIGLTNGENGSDPRLTFFMKARARLLVSGGKAVVHDQTFKYQSQARPYSEWGMNEAEHFQEAITQAYEDLAMRMSQALFLSVLTTWPAKAQTMPFVTDPYLLQPTLQWEVLSPNDISKLSRQVTDITYDIQIFDGDAPTDPVYVRSQIPRIVHTVDTPLEPCHTYLWNVRAAFQLDGSPRVTDWTVPEKPQEGAPLSESCISYLAMRADLNGPIIDVSEGNFFSIQGPATVERVQIPGITCPRGSHPLREKSKAAILALAKNVAVNVLEKNEEGRKVGEVLVFPSGQALDKELVKNGLCQWDWRYPDKVELQELEAEAKAAKRGVLWEEIQY